MYGALDGVITTLAVIAGATGASLGTRVAIILGLANLAADGLSMGASNYLGLKSELEQRGADVAREQPLRHGLATFVAFALAGAVPLGAFLLPASAGTTLAVAAGLGAVVLFATGAARARFLATRTPLAAGAEMTLVGALAALTGYGAGALAGRFI